MATATTAIGNIQFEIPRLSLAAGETAEFDCLRDEALIFVEKLKNGGVSVFINETKRTVHGYDMARKSDVAAQSLRLRLEALRQAFFKETSNV